MPSIHLTARSTRCLVAVALLILISGFAGCASPDREEPSAASNETGDSSAFPVTIHSALGDAVITEKPERVAWGWSSQDAVLALGVNPVAMPAYEYGGKDKVLPWDADAIDAIGGATPTLLSGTETGEPNIEEFTEARPDVILAPYSGLKKREFEELSKIAPVVAYPDKP